MNCIVNPELLLLDLADRWLHQPFVLGETDCGMSATEYLQALYGYDCAVDVRGKYKTLEELRATLGPLGLGGLMRRLAKRHDWHRVDPVEAQPGAVGLVFNGMTGVVICRKQGWFIGRGQSGVSLIPAVNTVWPERSVRLAWDTQPVH